MKKTQPFVECSVCKVLVRKDRLYKHFSRVHKDQTPNYTNEFQTKPVVHKKGDSKTFEAKFGGKTKYVSEMPEKPNIYSGYIDQEEEGGVCGSFHINDSNSNSYRSANPESRDPRDYNEGIKRCPHGVLKTSICAICDPEEFRKMTGID